MPLLINRKNLLVTALLFACLAFLIGGLLFFQYRQQSQEQIGQAIAQGHRETSSAAELINRRLLEIEQLTRAVAADLTSGKLPYPALKARLKQIHDTNADIFGVGAAFADNTYTQDTRSYAPYWTRRDEQQTFIQVEQEYDYLVEQNDWYQLPKAKGPTWIPPYFGEASQTMLAEFGVPFYRLEAQRNTQVFAGVVFINFSLKGLQELVASLNLGRTGYGFILSQQGKILVHPSEELVQEGVSIFALAEQKQDDKLLQLGEQAETGQGGLIDHLDQESGHSSWYFHQPIPAINGTLVAVFVKNEILNQTDHHRQQLIKLSISLVLGLQALIVLLSLLLIKTTERVLLANSIGFSLVMVLAVLVTWHVALRYPPAADPPPTKIVDPAGMKQFLSDYRKESAVRHLEDPLFVPTGLFLQSIQFLGGNNVLVTGYLWQRYSPDKHAGLSRGFVLPEAEEVEIAEAYRRQEGADELIGWYFNATLREHFAYTRYPFDREDVWLRIWHQDFDRNVVLTPDLQAYRMTNPSSRPGIENDFVLPGWDIDSSYFSYRLQSYNTNFGITNYVGQENFPELYFNVHLQRNFTDPFLSKLVPLLVVSIMLFATFLVVTKKQAYAQLTGFNVLSVVAGCAALFFVVIFDHISLRRRLEAPGVVYLEYFYFVLYLAILTVSLNSVIFVSNLKFELLEYQDNLLSKLFFWPALTGSILIITWLTFY